MTVAAPTARPAPPPAPRARANGNEPPNRLKTAVAFGPIPDGTGHRIVLFGPGGIVKTTLAATARGPVAFFDLDDSLPRLKQQLAESPQELDLRQVAAMMGDKPGILFHLDHILGKRE